MDLARVSPRVFRALQTVLPVVTRGPDFCVVRVENASGQHQKLQLTSKGRVDEIPAASTVCYFSEELWRVQILQPPKSDACFDRKGQEESPPLKCDSKPKSSEVIQSQE